MKSPPIQYPDEVARAMVEEFIAKKTAPKRKPARRKVPGKREIKR